jgi:hypothetical protein
MRPVPSPEDGSSGGLARKILVPKYRRNAPPTSRNHPCWSIRKLETKVNPNPAMHP